MFDRILHWHVESDASVLFVSFDAQRTNGVHGAGNVAESEIAITEMSDAASVYHYTCCLFSSSHHISSSSQNNNFFIIYLYYFFILLLVVATTTSVCIITIYDDV